MQARLSFESSIAARAPKTDRLILSRLLLADLPSSYGDDDLLAAHKIIVQWAELERNGRLLELTETQLQGDFLRAIFCDVLGYRRAVENTPEWTLEQHLAIEGETPDAVLGKFRQDDTEKVPLAVVELKGPMTHLDRHRSNGRSAVEQCWGYLNNTPTSCRWGIVSNMVSFRLYERDSTRRAYEHFSLQGLRDINQFRQFRHIFGPEGLIQGPARLAPRTNRLLDASRTRQSEVGDKLYETYSENRIRLIETIHRQHQCTIDQSIEMAQRLLDRIIFIAFCEDRQLLPPETIVGTCRLGGMTRATNPKWRNFKDLFASINEGNDRYDIPAYNGGLFQPHAVDDLELEDEPWTTFFATIGKYDFADEVNLDVLGRLFERSITELEKLKLHGMFGGDAEKAEQYARMPQSIKRKQLGIYYTPPELTSRIVQYTVTELLDERFQALAIELGTSKADARRGIVPDTDAYWRGCFDILRNFKILDPACGSGAFLFQAYNVLEHRYSEVISHLEPDERGDESGELQLQIPQFILNDNLYGVDLSQEAVEITQLALWIRSARHGELLANLSRNIVHGNSLVHDPTVHPAGFNWRERFPEVFDRQEAGFDCVIGNPPWERMDLSEREFFSMPAPDIATATTGAKRAKLVEKLATSDPGLFARFTRTRDEIDELRGYCHSSGRYPLTGRGRTNLYAVFAELAYQLVAPHGRVGLLTPSGIASDNTTKDFFAAIAENNRLIRLYDFENKKVFFPDVHASFKFCILNFSGEQAKPESADFVFFVHRIEELDQKGRHISLTGADIKLLNPNTRTCPIFRTRRDAEITKATYRRVPILIDRSRVGPTQNPWKIQFKQGLFNQTTDSGFFFDGDSFHKEKFKLKGNRWLKGKQGYLPLYEAKMLQAFDHRAASVLTDNSNWVRQGQPARTTIVEYTNPEFTVLPRFWVDSSLVAEQIPADRTALLCFKDVTSPTNQRTMIASLTPVVGVVNSAPIVLTELSPREECCLLANLNSFVYDFVARQKVSNVHLNFFIVEQLPTLPPDTYAKPCPWATRTKLEKWISERVLKLTCTAEDMLPLADACEFKTGSFKEEYGGRLNRWDEAERIRLMAELDAAYFHLYGISRDDAEYILTTFAYTQSPNQHLSGNQSLADFILERFHEMGG